MFAPLPGMTPAFFPAGSEGARWRLHPLLDRQSLLSFSGGRRALWLDWFNMFEPDRLVNGSLSACHAHARRRGASPAL